MNPDYNLAYLLENPISQRRFIAEAAAGFDELVGSQTKYSSSVIYGPVDFSDDEEEPAPQAMDLSGLLSQTANDTSYISIEHCHKKVKAFFDDINARSQPCAVLTWVVLVILFVCPRLREIVCENTEPALFVPFFDDYEKRFTVSLCGILVHKRERKEERSQIKTEALSPFEIVLQELANFHRIRTSPPVEYKRV